MQTAKISRPLAPIFTARRRWDFIAVAEKSRKTPLTVSAQNT